MNNLIKSFEPNYNNYVFKNVNNNISKSNIYSIFKELIKLFLKFHI